MLRLVALNQSLWLDEAILANAVLHHSFISLVTKFAPTDFHPPFYYLVLHAWTSIFGLSEISLRFPSIIFSLLTGYLVYKISRNRLATALYLFNPLIIYYSQEARMYSLITLLVLAAYYFFTRRQCFLFNLFVFLSLLTFYGSVFFYLGLFIYLIATRKLKIQHLYGFIFALIILLPLVAHQYFYSRQALIDVTNWSLVLGQANLKNLFLIPIKFFFGHISFYTKLAYYFFAGIWTLFCSVIFLKNSPRKYLFLILAPLLLAFLISFNSPMLEYFRYLYLIPFVSIVLAKSKAAPIIISGFIILSFVYLLIPNFHREDWRTLAAAIPSDTPVLVIPSFSDPLNYYHPGLTLVDIRRLDLSAPRYIVIPYGTAIYGFNYQNHLNSQNFHLVSTAVFRQNTLELWSR